MKRTGGGKQLGGGRRGKERVSEEEWKMMRGREKKRLETLG